MMTTPMKSTSWKTEMFNGCDDGGAGVDGGSGEGDIMKPVDSKSSFIDSGFDRIMLGSMRNEVDLPRPLLYIAGISGTDSLLSSHMLSAARESTLDWRDMCRDLYNDVRVELASVTSLLGAG